MSGLRWRKGKSEDLKQDENAKSEGIDSVKNKIDSRKKEKVIKIGREQWW